MHYKKPKDRNELLLDPHIDQWVAQDSIVRLLDLILDQFIQENDFSWSGSSNKGCTSYPPAIMLKLLLYCYYNWIPGSRRMEKETYRNIEVMWLLGGLKPDHWTICKFRRENKELIRLAAIAIRKFLLDNGYIEGKKIAFDGSKIKANAKREVFSEEGLSKRIKNIEQQLEKYLKNTEESDILEDMLDQETKENKELKDKIVKLEQEKKSLAASRNS
jgi:transposase